MALVFFAFAILIPNASVNSPPTPSPTLCYGIVTGSVTDVDGYPLEGVVLSNGSAVLAVTNSTGGYRIDTTSRSPYPYLLHPSLQGYEIARQTLRVYTDGCVPVAEQDFVLVRSHLPLDPWMVLSIVTVGALGATIFVALRREAVLKRAKTGSST